MVALAVIIALGVVSHVTPSWVSVRNFDGTEKKHFSIWTDVIKKLRDDDEGDDPGEGSKIAITFLNIIRGLTSACLVVVFLGLLAVWVYPNKNTLGMGLLVTGGILGLLGIAIWSLLIELSSKFIDDGIGKKNKSDISLGYSAWLMWIVVIATFVMAGVVHRVK